RVAGSLGRGSSPPHRRWFSRSSIRTASRPIRALATTRGPMPSSALGPGGPTTRGPPNPLVIADLRIVLADIPVRRPHHMSFTTLEAVNFVFVRLETRDGVVGWGEAACLGGPTWSEESAESIAAT